MATCLVELLGLPGSGKSTLCRRTVQVLRQRGVPATMLPTAYAFPAGEIVSKTQRGASLVRGLLRRPGFAYRSGRLILHSQQRSREDLWTALFHWLWVSAISHAVRRRPGIWVLDEGIFHALWIVAFNAGEAALAETLEGLLRDAPVPDLVVELRASPQTIHRRLRSRRGDSRLERQLPREVHVLERAGMLMERIAALVHRTAARHRAMEVLVLNSDREDELESNTAALADRLTNAYRRDVYGEPARRVARSVDVEPGTGD